MSDDQRAADDNSTSLDNRPDDDDLGGPLGQTPVSTAKPPTSPVAPPPLPPRGPRSEPDAPPKKKWRFKR
ncbi:hypothetical protein [Actinoplanes sp. NPDC049265]|uniref:hypothetical protein n=1 Tax=Actinoplanes sp. NPDC049265 TaxID=3363902 RepID=UPI00371DE390